MLCGERGRVGGREREREKEEYTRTVNLCPEKNKAILIDFVTDTARYNYIRLILIAGREFMNCVNLQNI